MKRIFTLLVCLFTFTVLRAQINENFDGTAPAGWSYSTVTIGTGQVCSGNALQFTGTGNAARTPAITNPATLTFDYKRSNNAAAWTLDIQYSSNAAGPWTTITSFTSTITSTCSASGSIDIASVTGAGTFYIRFLDTRASGSAVRGIDNVIITNGPTPSIAITNTSPIAGNVAPGAINVILQRYNLAVTTADASLTGLNVTTAGTYAAADLINLKVRYSADATLDAADATLSTKTSGLAPGTQTFPSFTAQSITAGTTGYIFVTADVATGATGGRTINAAAGAAADFTFAAGTKSATGLTAGGAQTIVLPTPDIAISANHPAAGTINQNSNNQPIASVALGVTTAAATINSIAFVTTGTYTAADLKTNPFKLYYTTTNTFAGTTQLGTAQPFVASGGTITFSGLSQSITAGTTGYLWLAVDVSATADPAKNIAVASAPFSNIVFASGNKTGIDPVPAGNTQTFAAVTPVVVLGGTAVPAGNINIGSTNNSIYTFTTAVSANNSTLTAATIPVVATSAADFVSNSFKLFYNSSNTLAGATQLGTGVSIAGGNLSFSGFSQSIAAGSTGYFFVTADVGAGATVGNSVAAGPVTMAGLTFSVPVSASGTAPSGGIQTIVAVPYAIFDNFDRTNSNIVGIPSSGGTIAWAETETSGAADARAIISGGKLMLRNTNGSGSAGNGFEQVSYNVSSKFATTYNTGLSPLTWIFNMRSSRFTPSGFGSNTYAAAFILGADEENATSATADGYAVIIGNSGSPDPVKLVRFSNGLTTNANVADICVSSVTSEQNYYSVKVVYNPCNNQWSLQVADNGSSDFADPTTIAASTIIATDATHVGKNLQYIICAYQHGASVGESAYFDNIYIPTSAVNTGIYTWNGTVSTDFQVPANWTPARSCTRPTDVLQFTAASPATSNVTNVPAAETIGQLKINGNRTVSFRDAATAGTSVLTIAGLSTGDDFIVEAGSVFKFDVSATDAATDAMIISLTAGATAAISGDFQFVNTNTGTAARPHRLLAAASGAITVNNGGRITAVDLEGSPFGDTGAENVITYAAGAEYVSLDGGNPFGFAQPQSKVLFSAGSKYTHNQSAPPSMVGRAYADFDYNFSGGALPVLFGNASAVTSMNNFSVSAGTLSLTAATNNLPININVAGNLTVAAGATLNYSPASATAASNLAFTGNTMQTISAQGTLTLGNNMSVIINNTAATAPQVVLGSSVTVNGNVVFTDGIIGTGSNKLIFSATATTAGASDASHVDGIVEKINNTTAFIYPTGDAGYYAPAMLGNNPGTYNVEYVYASAAALGSVTAGGIVRVSGREYWNINRISGTGSTDITLTYADPRSGGVAIPANLRLAHFDGTSWSTAGTEPGTGSTTVGTVAWAGYDGSYSPFTIATTTENNPLPVMLTAFDVTSGPRANILSWDVANEKHFSHYEAEHSRDAQTFSMIDSVPASGSSSYTAQHNSPEAGVNHYRLKMIDEDGSYTYSAVRTVINQAGNNISVYPNPVTDVLTVNAIGKSYIRLMDASGKIICEAAAADVISMNVQGVPAGIYFLEVISGSDHSVLRIEKK